MSRIASAIASVFGRNGAATPTRGQEITGPQTVSGGRDADSFLVNPLPATYQTYREMRRDPTIRLARILSIAPIISGEWKYEGENEEQVEFVREIFEPMRTHILRTALKGCIDFGWQGYEKIFAPAENQRITLRKLKPLLHDLTEIGIDRETGAFLGYRQRAQGLQVGDVIVPLEMALHIAQDVEGTQWHGESSLESVRPIYNEWLDANKGASRYDRKVAGSHWVVKYPEGRTIYKGAETDNGTIAKDILSTLEASGSIAIPQKLITRLNKAGQEEQWQIELMADSSARQPAFVDRLKYLDGRMVRGLGWPERAILEGEFGTKAESEAHGALALLAMEEKERDIVQTLNWHCVNQLTRMNWNEENVVKIAAADLSPIGMAFKRRIYEAILGNPSGLLEELDRIDRDALREELDIPSTEAEEAEGQLRGLVEQLRAQQAGARGNGSPPGDDQGLDQTQ